MRTLERAFLKALLLIASAVVIQSSTALADESAADKCARLMTSQKNPDVQQQIQIHEQQIIELMGEHGAKLGLYNDPFAMAFTVEQGDRIFKRLSVRPVNGKWKHSALGIINFNLKRVAVRKLEYNPRLIQWIIDDSKYWLKSNSIEKVDLQSNLLALKYSLEYLRKFKEPDIVVDREGEKEQTPEEVKKQELEKEEKKEEKKPEKPEYPESPKEYKPHTKDTKGEGGGEKQEKLRVAEVNFVTPLFAQIYYSEISRGSPHPFRQTVLPSPLAPPKKYQLTPRLLTVRTYGKRKVDLFLPPMHKPLQPSDPRATITTSEGGNYVLELKEDLEEINIPLVEDSNNVLMSHVREIYTRPVGFRDQEWPDEIQANIIRKFPAAEQTKNPLLVSQAIASHISKEYLYSVGPRPETDPIAALNAGAFQCDIGAYIMVSLLRDVYKIPSRVVGGYRANSYKDGKDNKSYLVIPGEAHAWVEVFHNGRWHPFDPTPIKKDKAEKEDKEESDYSQIPVDNTAGDVMQDGDSFQGEGSGQGEGEGNQKDSKERLKEDTEKREKEVAERGKGQQEEKIEDLAPLTQQELADQLEIGSLEIKPKIERNPLLDRALRILLRITLAPNQQGSEIQNRLNKITKLIKEHAPAPLKALYQKALSAHRYDHPDIKNWIGHVTRLMTTQEVNKSYNDLYQIILALQVYTSTLDANGKVRAPVELIQTLEQARKLLAALKHPDADDIALVQAFVKDLPPLVRQLLATEYDLTNVGPNQPTKAIAEKIKALKMIDLKLISVLSPLTDFILNSTPHPEYLEVKAWQRDTARPRGNEFLPLQRFSDAVRAFLGQPGKSLEENIAQGTAYVPVRRQRVKIPAGHGKEESERITIVLFDTSGSMAGDPGDFQAGLISAFTGKAISDVSPSGKHRHKVILLPFDDEPGEPIRVTNATEAMEVIRDYRKKLANTNRGTDIQKVLLQAMSLIADAERRSGEPLAAANIILMTDGQAVINQPELLRARNAISRKTPLQTMFIAINSTNEELMKFAFSSKSIGAEQGFYREFSPEHIQDLLAQSKRTTVADSESFYSDKSATQIPSLVFRLMNIAAELAARFSEEIYQGSHYVKPSQHLQDLEKIRWNRKPRIERPLENWLIKTRRVLQLRVFKEQKTQQTVVDDLVTNFEAITGIQLNDLGDFEQEHLRHLIQFAADQEKLR